MRTMEHWLWDRGAKTGATVPVSRSSSLTRLLLQVLERTVPSPPLPKSVRRWRRQPRALVPNSIPAAIAATATTTTNRIPRSTSRCSFQRIISSNSNSRHHCSRTSCGFFWTRCCYCAYCVLFLGRSRIPFWWAAAGWQAPQRSPTRNNSSSTSSMGGVTPAVGGRTLSSSSEALFNSSSNGGGETMSHAKDDDANKSNDDDKNKNIEPSEGSLIALQHVMVHHLTHPVQSTHDEARRVLQAAYDNENDEKDETECHNNNNKYNEESNLQSICSSSRNSNNPKKLLHAVIADIQLAGRGTHGRTWARGTLTHDNNVDNTSASKSSDGNLFLTIAIPMEAIPVTLTLLPLQIAVLVAERVSSLIQKCGNTCSSSSSDAQVLGQVDTNDGEEQSASTSSRTTTIKTNPQVVVKWPNDVLVNHAKISGTLIETFSAQQQPQPSYSNNRNTEPNPTSRKRPPPTTWFLVGIGVNVRSAPLAFASESTQQHQHHRKACCIQDFCPRIDDDDGTASVPLDTAKALGVDLAEAVANWVYQNYDDHSNSDRRRQRDDIVLQQWKTWAIFGQEYKLRNDHRVLKNGNSDDKDSDAETVVTLGIERDGQLRVLGSDGRERLLLADYLL